MLATLLSGMLVTQACTGPSEPESILTDRVAVGFATDQPGFGSLDIGRNQFNGFDVDLANWLSRTMEPKFNIVGTPVSVDDRITALENGSVQMVVQSFSITDERLEKIDMAGPYLYSYLGVLVRRGEEGLWPDPSALPGRTACTPRGSTAVEELKSRGASVTDDDGLKQCVDRLRSRNVDAVATDQILLYGYASSDLTVIPHLTFGQRQEYGVGLPKGNYETCRQVTAAISQFIEVGEWDRFMMLRLGEFDRDPHRPDFRHLNECPKRESTE
ncbi:transporter substrate-binding domain-containing protein [Pseudonocardia sp. DSM 110487]|uniref:transporter substrate-binding domain-containing protein n=1 Tax=Pseudonocardia sp. DSM 110487 TaxID=2865833 RepID=UPI001C69446B|nr:transporter substrate-binding domain-containing protein [Pseudonocardia sp. DSM 110487]QYN31677.1 transporter substrate-binding domain-containing protein [Pseudonocardia sp. DSM 110487]